jgi:hypothetical protein
MSIDALRLAWEKTFGNPPPPRAGQALLALGIGWHQQSRMKGGLDRATSEEISRLVRDVRVRRELRIVPRKVEAGRGTTLVREWNGKTYQVQVLETGFLFENRVSRSLSEIARAITGVRCNGPKFFGLRSKEAA